MVITINPNTDMLPLNVATARAVPRAYEEESKTVTEMLLEKNVITEVSTPKAWCSPGFFVPKPGGKGCIRLVVDYKELNKCILRPVHPFPCTNDILPTAPCKVPELDTLQMTATLYAPI